MTICIGKPIIKILAKEGAWSAEDGENVVAADELFGADPYAEIERLRDALKTVLGDAAHGQKETWKERCRIGREALEGTSP